MSAAIIAILLLLVLLAVPYLHSAVVPMDEGSLLVYPSLVAHGAVPQRDFETMYGPGNIWVLALVFRFVGASVIAERSVGLVYRAGIVLAIFLLGRSRGTLVALTGGILAAALTLSIGLPAYAWLGAVALALFSAYFAIQARHVFLAGLLGGFALLYRPDLVLAIAAIALVLPTWRYVKGLLVGLSPYVVHVSLIGPITAFRRMFVSPVLQSAPRRLPLPLGTSLFWAIVAPILCFVVIGLLQARNEGSRNLLALALFTAGLLPQALQRPDSFHLVAVGCVSVSLIPLYVGSFPAISAGPRGVLLGLLIAIGLVPLVGVGLRVSGGTFTQTGFPVTNQSRTVYVLTEGEQEELSTLMAKVDQLSKPGDRLFVGPRDLTRTVDNDTFLYFLLPDLTPASYYLEMNPGSANRPGSGLAQDISSADFVILTNRYKNWDEPNASRVPGSIEPELVIQQRFCSVIQTSMWELLQRC